MYYQIHGEGEPLVLLHGFTGSGADWRFIFDEPPGGFQLVIPDMRGHGQSTNPTNEFTHRQSALDLFALLDKLGIERFKAIGLSAGGNTLLHMAAGQPYRVEAMVIVSATTHFPEQARAIMRAFTIDSLTEADWEVQRRRHKHGDEQIRALWMQGNAFKDSYDDLNFTASDLSRIAARTLIVYGDRDPFYPVSIAADMYAAIPRSYLWIIPNGGHGPVFGEMKEHFVETALAFIAGKWDPKSQD